MKSKYIFLLVFVIQATSFSQAIRTVGVKVGAVSASQTWHYASIPDLDTERRWGIDFGVYAEWLNMPVFSFSTEVHYVQKGMKESLLITTEQNPDGTGEYLTRSPRVDYLSVPVLAKARLLDGELSPYIVADPRVDFLLQTKGEGFDLVLDRFAKVDFGATVGVGFEIKSLEVVKLGIEFRFSPSLKDGFSSAFMNVRNNSMEFFLVAGI